MLDFIVAVLREIPFRGKARLISALSDAHGERTCRIFGSHFLLDLSDHIQRHMYWGTFEPAETRHVRALLKPGMTVVDVGANVGHYTALAAQCVGPTGRVVSFEPSAYAFHRLQRWALTNRVPCVHLIHAGLSDSPGTAQLYLGDTSDNHTPTMVAHDNTTTSLVPVSTLDLYARQLDLAHIDLLKLDVEGWEEHVLNGAQNLLTQGRITYIFCEFNDQWLTLAGSSIAQLTHLLHSYGFSEDISMRSADNKLYVNSQSARRSRM
jgi:FkbM family methyltransferase